MGALQLRELLVLASELLCTLPCLRNYGSTGFQARKSAFFASYPTYRSFPRVEEIVTDTIEL